MNNYLSITISFNYIYSTATWQATELFHLKIKAKLSFPLMGETRWRY